MREVKEIGDSADSQKWKMGEASLGLKDSMKVNLR